MRKEAIILTGFVLSNAAALVYEVVWARQLAYLFGTSALAVSTVLASFMCGLAIGSYFLGRLADRATNPARLFAFLELGIGLYGLVSMALLRQLSAPYLLLRDLAGGSASFPLLLFVLSFAAMIVPTTLVGGTFPLIGKIYAQRRSEIGRKIGIAYSLDTLGAAAGAWAAGFVLVPALGLSSSIMIAALLNIAVGAVVYVISASSSARARTMKPRVWSGRDKVLLASFFISGAAALAYEVTWTRILSWIFGSSVYAFSTILATFLLGLALGSYAIGRIADRRADLMGMFALVELGIGASALLLVHVFSRLDVVYYTIFSARSTFGMMWIAFFAVIFAILLIPALLMGATMPILARAYARGEAVGGDIGTLFASNTVGGVLGAFAAGFFLVPIGVETISLLAASANLLVALAALEYSNMGRRASAMAMFAFLILALPTAAFGIDVRGLGIYYNTNAYNSLSDYKIAKQSTAVLFEKDDPHGLVTATKVLYLSLRINGKTDAGGGRDIPTEYMLAYAPLFTHGNATKVLNIGLGGGYTLSAIEDLDVKVIHVVEINPAVVEATKQVFHRDNDDALGDPRVKLIIADARNYLSASDESYDVIISEPSNPWIAGEGGLFTKEFYELAKKRLREGGVFAQWIPLYDHDAEDFKLFLRTFSSAFPNVQVYSAAALGDAIVIGSTVEKSLDYRRLAAHVELKRVKAHMDRMKGVLYYPPPMGDVDYFLSFYLLDADEVKSYVAGSSDLNTDDRPLLDFRTARVQILKSASRRDPLIDIAEFKLSRNIAILASPPLENASSIEDGDHVFELFGVAFSDVDGEWKLVSSGYWRSLHRDLTSFDILRSVVYQTPGGELTWVRYDELPASEGRNGMRSFLSEVQGILEAHIRDMGALRIGGEEAFLFTDGHRFFVLWPCRENSATYLMMLPFGGSVEQLEDVFSRARCVGTR